LITFTIVFLWFITFVILLVLLMTFSIVFLDEPKKDNGEVDEQDQ
jgi:heme/copper-type cytochrome/quinol oxidase subunit 2